MLLDFLSGKSHAALLPPPAIEELRSLVETYDRLKGDGVSTNAGTNAEIDAMRAKLTSKPETIWWSDLMQVQLCLISLMEPASLRSALCSWRRRMQEVIGDARYAQYLAGAPNINSAAVTDDMVRADLGECVTATYYFYGAYGVAAKSRSDVAKATLRVACGVLAIEAIIALAVGFVPLNQLVLLRPALEWMLGTSAAAVMGSVISVQRRLQDPTVNVDPFYRYIQTKADRFGIAFASPLFGAVFGFVMYALLAGKLVGAKIIEFNATTFVPDGSADKAVLLLFGFLAGFAEQLVPDALTRLAAQTLGTITGGGANTAPSLTGGGGAVNDGATNGVAAGADR